MKKILYILFRYDLLKWAKLPVIKALNYLLKFSLAKIFFLVIVLIGFVLHVSFAFFWSVTIVPSGLYHWVPSWNILNHDIYRDSCGENTFIMRNAINGSDLPYRATQYSLWLKTKNNEEFVRTYDHTAYLINIKHDNYSKNNDSCTFYVTHEHWTETVSEDTIDCPKYLEQYLVYSEILIHIGKVRRSYYYRFTDTFYVVDNKISKSYYITYNRNLNMVFRRQTSHPTVNRVRIEDDVKRTFPLSEG